MADKLIMEVLVSIEGKDVSFLKGPAGEVVMIPFGGTVQGEIFNGVVCPGGVDCQRVNLTGVRHMCARYMLEGTDSAGEKCHIFVDNNGWFNGMQSPFQTVPTFMTDSKTLAPYLHQNKFRGEGHPREGGVTIKFFEVDNG
ncbi:MAG: DUF3237 family protein [Oscillospiraceae bacterium]|jgi:hypothetical protein|nr:DUF3237 family protein [Oscillospiraceae bacterium]MBR5702039.1 DUF3237 family protein [Oscillospiraceae bacterium]